MSDQDTTNTGDSNTDDQNLGDGAGTSGDATNTHTNSNNQNDSGQVDLQEYNALKKKFHEVSAEAKKYREKASLSSKEAAEAKKLATDAIAKVDQSNSLSNKRIINAELKILAAKEGLIDPDAFKMIDLSTVTVADSGDVVGADALMADLKKNKPYLFKSSSSNSTDAAPNPSDTAVKTNFMEMSDKEYAEKNPASWRRNGK